ncbi:AzlD domain-containing protein [Marinicrinis lubricantis]|uniref:AzlD domain-containing protein n=1 Tax=Marinicrinis lubricantis TaxID=2086470 RepID=A0ABW1IK39_9BACL
MKVDMDVLLIILGGAIVTLIPRVLPFLLVRNIRLPQPVLKWLSFIPICILSALVIQSVIIKEGTSISIDWPVLMVIVPTALAAVWTKSLSVTVVVGVLLMALTRAFII